MLAIVVDRYDKLITKMLYYLYQDIEYEADANQIEALLNRSITCRQRLTYNCKRSKLMNSPGKLKQVLNLIP
jgi:hypothetical protein